MINEIIILDIIIAILIIVFIVVSFTPSETIIKYTNKNFSFLFSGFSNIMRKFLNV